MLQDDNQEDEEVTLDDLPVKFDLPKPGQEAALAAKAEEEDCQTSGMQAVLNSMKMGTELAGDPAAIKEPGECARLYDGIDT